MIKGVYSLITAIIITSWGYFGEPGQVLARHRTPEERERAFEKSTWSCQNCNKVNGVNKTRCQNCGTSRGFPGDKEKKPED